MPVTQNLSGKKILLFTPQGKGIYGTAIFNELERKGAEVYIYNERPSTSTLTKIAYRLAGRFLQAHFAKYLNGILKEVKTSDFDYVLIIRGEAFSPKDIKKLRLHFPKAKFILYLWDSLKNNDTRRLFPHFDRVFSFDLEDCKKNPNLIFRPLFFIREYENIADKNQYHNDLVFVGTLHSGRLLLLQRVEKYLKQHGLTVKSYLYFPSRLLYLRKKLTDRSFKGYSPGDFNYKMLPAKEVSRLLAESKVSLDMQGSTQSGLTMRTIEVLGAKRKLLTTNKQIAQYDFYHPENIQIIDLDFKELNLVFFKTPFKEIPESIYYKYALRNWIDEVLNINNPHKEIIKKGYEGL